MFARVFTKELTQEQVDVILALHEERLNIEEAMQTASGLQLKHLNVAWMTNQGYLQLYWGFERDERFIRFWEVPGCTYPAIDNSEAWPTGYYSISGACPIHGGF